MAGNSIGKKFKLTNWGESHGKALGVIIDGCPPLLELKEKDIQKELDRRRPGQNRISTPRKEADKVEILSGVFEGKTTGAPISLIIYNKNQKNKDYKELKNLYRPGHADFTYEKKYEIRDPFGGGRSSARITAGNVAGGAIAKKILLEKKGVEILAYVKQIKDIKTPVDSISITKRKIEKTPIRCPDKNTADKMMDFIEKVAAEGDSVGGIIECVIKNVPPGLGEPIFHKLNADLAHAMMSINAARGIEFGKGFDTINYLGSELNDSYIIKGGKIVTETNHTGGILGGISTGMDIVFRVVFKPTPTIKKEQYTVNKNSEPVTFQGKGRHDPCVLPRAVPIVEAMAAIILCDHYLSE